MPPVEAAVCNNTGRISTAVSGESLARTETTGYSACITPSKGSLRGQMTARYSACTCFRSMYWCQSNQQVDLWLHPIQRSDIPILKTTRYLGPCMPMPIPLFINMTTYIHSKSNSEAFALQDKGLKGPVIINNWGPHKVANYWWRFHI
jgi:hypothetical protein